MSGTVVASLVLAVLLAAAFRPELLDPESAAKKAAHLGVSKGLYLLAVGACRGLVLVGLIVGLFWWPMEIVAASGVILLMVFAVASSDASSR
jgi:hypothetical protein